MNNNDRSHNNNTQEKSVFVSLQYGKLVVRSNLLVPPCQRDEAHHHHRAKLPPPYCTRRARACSPEGPVSHLITGNFPRVKLETVGNLKKSSVEEKITKQQQ